MRATPWTILLIVLIGTLSVEGRSTKRKFLQTPGQFDIVEKLPVGESNRQARQSTNCIITGKNERQNGGKSWGKPPPPEDDPTCIIIVPPAPVVPPAQNTTPVEPPGPSPSPPPPTPPPPPSPPPPPPPPPSPPPSPSP